jgi:hypothetical protein
VQQDVDRLLALVCRELGAREAVVVVEPARDDARELRCALPSREEPRALVARFDAPPLDRDAKQRRLEMLASTFDGFTAPLPRDDASRPRSRPPVARSLQDELRGLCAKSAAVNALVVDANSPVVWGAAKADGLGDEWPLAGDLADVADEDAAPRSSAAPSDLASLAAIEAVRNLPSMAALRRGRHLRHVEREGAGPFLAHSFAGIYCLVVVYAAAFDELRAERAVVEAVGRIEQLVLALPPLDPTPEAGAGVIMMPRRRRR